MRNFQPFRMCLIVRKRDGKDKKHEHPQIVLTKLNTECSVCLEAFFKFIAVHIRKKNLFTERNVSFGLNKFFARYIFRFFFQILYWIFLLQRLASKRWSIHSPVGSDKFTHLHIDNFVMNHTISKRNSVDVYHNTIETKIYIVVQPEYNIRLDYLISIKCWTILFL